MTKVKKWQSPDIISHGEKANKEIEAEIRKTEGQNNIMALHKIS